MAAKISSPAPIQLFGTVTRSLSITGTEAYHDVWCSAFFVETFLPSALAGSLVRSVASRPTLPARLLTRTQIHVAQKTTVEDSSNRLSDFEAPQMANLFTLSSEFMLLVARSCV